MECRRVLFRSALAVALGAIPAGCVPVLSDETLTADPRLTVITAQRLHHHFPQARIVFTIRRQEDMIRSFYGRHGRVLVNVPAPYTDRPVSFAACLEHPSRNLPAGILPFPASEPTTPPYPAPS